MTKYNQKFTMRAQELNLKLELQRSKFLELDEQYQKLAKKCAHQVKEKNFARKIATEEAKGKVIAEQALSLTEQDNEKLLLSLNLQKKDIDILVKRKEELDERNEKLEVKNEKLLLQQKQDRETIMTINERLNQIDMKTEEEIILVRTQDKNQLN